MNKVYRVIWNASLGAWVAVSELAKSKSKSKSVKKTAQIAIVATTIAFAVSAHAQDIDEDLNVTGDITATGEMTGSDVTTTNGASLNELNNKVNDTSTGLATKASQTDFNTLNNQVNNTTTGLATKASKDDVNAAKTEVLEGNNIKVTPSNGSNGQTIYTVQTADEVTFNKVTVGGTIIDDGQITVAKDGTIAAGSQQVITGNQFYELEQKLFNSGAQGIKYFHANSNLDDSAAYGTDSVAVGPKAITNKSATDSIAIGTNALVGTQDDGTTPAPTDGVESIAIGKDTIALGNKNTVIGQAATVDSKYVTSSLALGDSAKVTGDDSNNALAIGSNAVSSAAGASAIGNAAAASGSNATAIGGNSNASATNATAIGENSTAGADAGTAIGSNSQANSTNAVSIGSNAGLGTTNLPGNANQNHIAIGTSSGQNITGNENIAIGLEASNNTSGSYNIAIGSKAGQGATGEESVSIGYISNQGSTAINHTTALGARTQSGQNAVAVGYSANASNQGAVAVGSLSKVQGVDDGTGNITNADNGVALGTNAWSQDNSIALGANSIASSTASQTQAGYITSALIGDQGVVSVGADSNGSTASFNRRIVHVADGAGDYDAVNVNQLRKAQEKVADIIGGNVTVNSQTGDYSQITLKDTSGKEYQYNTVVEALGALSTGAIQLPATENAVTYTDASSKQINLRPNTVISGVAEGKVGTDAVNLEQMQQAVEESRAKYISVNSTTKGNRANEGATGINAVAIGPDAIAANNNSTAIGSKVQSLGDYATVIGTADSVVYDTAGVAIGNHAISRGEGSIVIGKDAKAEPQTSPTGKIDNAIAIGTQALVTNEKGIAIGQNTIAEGAESIAQGYDSRSIGNASTAIGVSSRASAENAYALGTNANSSATNALAFGNAAKSTATDSIATGTNATTYATNAVALGKGAVSGKANPTKEEIDNNSNSDTIAIGTNSFAQIKNSLAVGNTARATEESSLALGTESQATAEDAISVGQKSQASGLNSLALGKEALATQESAIAQGYGAKALNTNTIAQGVNAQASADYAIVTGTNALATGKNAIAQGLNAQAMANNAVAIGANTSVTNANAVALGSNSVSGNYNQTTKSTINGRDYNYAGSGASLSTVSVGSKDSERQIINVAAGRVSSTSTDAINGSQLFAVQQEVQQPLSFAGDSGTKVDRKLGEELKITGGATSALTEGNIGVVANGSDTLQLKLAKDVNLTSAGSLTVGNSKVTDGKVEIKDSSNNSNVSTSTNNVITAGASTNTIDANTITLKNAANNVVLSGTTGTLTGLTNKTLSVSGFATEGRAATEEQLKLVNDTVNKGWNITTNKDTANKSNVAPDATVDFSNSDNNITVSHTDTNVDVKLAEVVNIGGQPGGATISVNGKNGTITGLTNKTFDPNNYTTGRAATEDQLATPLTFTGDNAGVNVQRKLGEQLSIVGGESVAANLTDNNIGVVADSTTNKLTVKLSKDIKLDSVNAAGTVIDSKGLTFVDSSGGAIPNSPSISATGINAGTNKITNVGAGAITDTSMDAVNGSQIKGIIDKGFTVSSNGNTAAKDTIALGENVDFSATDNNIKVTNTGNNQITFGLEPVIKVGPATGGNPVTIDGNTGEITGLTNKTTTSSDFATVGRAATEEQLKTIQTGLTDSGFGLKAADSNTVNKKLGETIDIVGADSNITTKVVNDQIAVELSKNIDLSKAGSLTVGNSEVTDGKVELNDGTKSNTSTVDGTVVSDGTNTTTIGTSQITVGAGSNPVIINGATGLISGLSNTTWDPNATYNQKQAATEEQLKSVSDVAQNANQGWNVKSDSTLASTQVKPADTVDIGLANGENNLKVAATNSNGTTTIDFSLNRDLLLDSVNAGGTVIDNTGLRFVDPITGLPLTNSPSISLGGINAGNQIISNVAPGQNGTDAVNVNQLNDVKAIAEEGWIFTTATSGKGQVFNSSLQTIKPNQTFTMISGDNVELIQNGDKVTITTTPEVSFDKVNVGNVVIDKTTNKITGVEAGTVAANSKDVVNGSQLHDLGSGVQNIIGGNTTYDPNTGTYTNNNIGDTGQNNINDAIKSINDTAQNANKGWTVSTNGQNASQVKPTDTVDFSNNDGNIQVNNTGNNITVDLAKDIQVDSVTAGNTTLNNNGLTITGGPSVTIDGIDAGGNKVTGVAEGSIAQGSKDAVNGSQIHDIIGDGAFQGGDGNTITNIGGTGATNINDAIGSINQKAGQHSTVEAGQNITVKESTNINGGKEYTVATADDVKFNSVTSNTVTANNVKVGDVNIDQNGINAGNHKITNVAPGEISSTSKDAVNGSQLNTSNQYIVNSLGGGAKYENGQFTGPTYNVNNGSYNNVGDALGALNQADINLGNRITNLGDRLEQVFYNVNGRIDDVEKKANAGIASAMALEGAPFVAGKFTYAVGAAYHGGENAVGATLRKTADNGRWSITGGVAAASQGDPSVRVGISGVID
ncbi:YadA-like family protein [Acinetobacter sp. WU_MDCI_Axc73]|nr:YadA-like family protein [Acinetobacter sp. WU_MDCI_Axc73]